MQQRPIKVLLVEHDPQHARDLRDSLNGTPDAPVEVERVGELAEALQRLSAGGIDVILLDLDLPDSEGIETFERTYAFAPDVPVVVLTDEDEKALALATVRGGAQDHLPREGVTSEVVERSLRYAIERHRLISALRSLSLIDDLTGLYNREGFMALGDQVLDLARRNRRDAALIYLDLDRFRTINDTLGHHVGDRALLKVAEILRASFRRSDIVARMAGDEFAVLAAEASTESAETLLKRLREHFDRFNEASHEPYHLAASFGMARNDGTDGETLSELLAQAMERMRSEKAGEATIP